MLAGMAIAQGAAKVFETGLDIAYGSGPQTEQSQQHPPEVDKMKQALVSGTLEVGGANKFVEQIRKELMSPANFGL